MADITQIKVGSTTYDIAPYWANVKTTGSAAYNKEPEVASVAIGNGTTSAGTKKVTLVYDATNEVLNFNFT